MFKTVPSLGAWDLNCADGENHIFAPEFAVWQFGAVSGVVGNFADALGGKAQRLLRGAPGQYQKAHGEGHVEAGSAERGKETDSRRFHTHSLRRRRVSYPELGSAAGTVLLLVLSDLKIAPGN